MEKFKSVDKLVNQLKPSNPVYCIRGESLKKASNFLKIPIHCQIAESFTFD